ncbi:hypothetical protein ENTCAN_08988 [Enterobacter cancerogenus ATCC 35316]|nr:hypothetical protein ENTCAN_08988 [Enterobacter cancerogenus ATCC 35316]
MKCKLAAHSIFSPHRVRFFVHLNFQSITPVLIVTDKISLLTIQSY